jgi:hypothetical protein
MKRILLVIALMILTIFMITPGEVKADPVNIFDVYSISSYQTDDYGTTGKQITITIEDSTLAPGYYKIIIPEIYRTPDILIGYRTGSVYMTEDYYYLEDEVVNENHPYVFGFTYDAINESIEMYIRVIDGLMSFIFIADGTADFSNTESNNLNLELYLELEDLDPVFTYSQATLEVPYYDLLTLQDILALITVEDDIDGDLTSSIQVYSDAYSDWEPDGTLPLLSIVFSSTDSSNNTAYLQVDIQIFDDKIPEVMLSGVQILLDTDLQVTNITYSQFTIEIYFTLPYHQFSYQVFKSILEQLNYYDYSMGGPDTDWERFEHTPFLNKTTYYLQTDINETFFTWEGEFNPSYSIDGDFEDGNGNYFNIQLIFTLTDNLSPVVTSPSTITKSKSTNLSTATIQSLLQYTDNIDDPQDITVSIVTNTYQGKENKLGRYEIVFSVKDTSDNETLHTVVIWVLDLIPPVWTLDNRLVTISLNDPMSAADIIDKLEDLGIIVTELSYSVSIQDDQYTGNENVPGTYLLSLLVEYEDNTSEVINLSITVDPDYSVNWWSTLNVSDFGSLALSVTIPLLLVYLVFRKKK